ncbi:cation channel sperm-associated protein 1 [Balaenoptera acutorostrata]|uniref:Cation channel sperm-associated protein 1 n=1 Tax=Balaenoptera acutorostrata TaxID=9767 RepID=A0A383Z8T6_BALAC|nr:cation channel sperm-associated protein 1 [Balaenoptera acutorostrata]
MDQLSMAEKAQSEADTDDSAMVESTAITKGCPVPMVSPTIMAYPLIVVDLKTSMTMPSPAIPTTPTTPPTTVRPTIMVEPTTPHPSSRIPPVALSSPTIPMVRTTLMMSTTTVAGDIMGGPTNTGSPTTMVGFTTTVRFPTIVGFITKHEAHHHRRPASTGSYRHDGHLHGHRAEHHHGEHQHGAHPRDYLLRDHRYGEHRRGSSQLFGPYASHSVASASLAPAYSRQVAPQPSKPDRQTSVFSLARSLNTVHSHPAQTSSKVHPQGSSSKTSESWPKEDEQIQKCKTGRAPRTHKKLHTVDLFYFLWEKLSHLIWGLSRMLRKLTDSLAFEAFIVFIVCLNTIMLVAQTFAEVEVRGEWYFMALDSIFLCIYVVEAVLKIIALGLKYFLDPWNNLDFFIMVMAVLDFMLMQVNSSSMRVVYNQSIFRIFKVFKSLRALRAIRVLRRLSFLTSLQEVTGTLARSLPSITAILILMFTCLFLFSVVLRALFRYSDPKRFQNIFTTIFTLFTLLTLDDWSLIYLDSRAQGAWYIIPILMIYIIIQYFIFLNLVIAVLVDNFQMALLKGLEKVKQEKASQIHEKLLDDSLIELIEAEPKEVISGHTIQKQLIEKKFGAMTEEQQELLFHFLQLVSGVEHFQQKFRSQAAVIDEIVDTAFEAGEEDFRK